MANLGYIQLSRVCNQTCIFCSNPDNGTILTYEEGCNHIDDFIQRGYHGIILTGGEPTINPHLRRIVEYATEKGMATRMITNGQKIADRNYLDGLIKAGLSHFHLSLYSYREEIHDYLTVKKGAHRFITTALKHLVDYPEVIVNINTVINRYNADHLHRTVQWWHENFPNIKHQVWNNLDPKLNRTEAHLHTIPKFTDFEVSLYKAMMYLHSVGLSFRVERVPLCYMAEFAHTSTETRKMVKDEERMIHFLDFKGTYRQDQWYHEKSVVCQECALTSICGGIHGLDEYFPDEVYPIFLKKESVAELVKKTTVRELGSEEPGTNGSREVAV